MYTVRGDPPQSVEAQLHTFDPLIRKLLFARGIGTKEEAEVFFGKEWERGLCDPMQYHDMEKAAHRVLRAIALGEGIGIYGDYDCDGVAGAAALHETICMLGCNRIVHYTPHRNEEGFGISEAGVQAVCNAGIRVLCVVDCGSSDCEMVARVEAQGIAVLIFDHHTVPGEKASAYALINPLVDGIDGVHPCGAGCVFQFVRCLLSQARDVSITPGWEKWLLDLVGLATIADMVPLLGENRLFAHYGITVLRKSRRPGIQALCSAAGITQQTLTEDELSFTVIPYINSTSRMDHARVAFQLLTTSSAVEATTLARHVRTLNDRRKQTVMSMMRKVHSMATGKDAEKKVWVFGDRAWLPSLAGLAATRASNEYGKTVFVWGMGGTKVRGSCRSYGACDVARLMQRCISLFEHAGGHARAGGFTLLSGSELVIEDALNETYEETPDLGLVVDAECTVQMLRHMGTSLEGFAPFGVGNEKPRLALSGCSIKEVTRFGVGKLHTRYLIEDRTDSISGINFFSKPVDQMRIHTLIGHLDYDAFRREQRFRVERFIS